MFEVTGTKSINAGDLEFRDKGIDFVGRTGVNNGVQGCIGKQEHLPNEEGTLTISQVGTITTQYRDAPYYVSQNIAKLKYIEALSKEYGLYLTTTINKHMEKYMGYNTPKLEDIRGLGIELPVLSPEDTEPYWDYMAYFIHNIQQQYADQLEVKSEYELDLMCQILGVTREDIVQRVEFTQPQYTNKFTVDEIFDIKSTKKAIHKNTIADFNGEYPYVTRKEGGNGVDSYINEDTQYLNPGNTITLARDTYIFYYQKEPYFTGDKIKIITYEGINETNALYMVTLLNKKLGGMTWGQTMSMAELNKIELELPVLAPNSKQIDWGAIRHAAVGGGGINYLATRQEICNRDLAIIRQLIQ